MNITITRPFARPATDRRGGAVLAAFLVAALAGPIAAGPAAAGLFEPAESGGDATLSRTPQAKRARLANIDRGYLESIFVPRGMDTARDRLKHVPAAETAQVELFSGLELTIDRDRISRAHAGGYVWSGTVRGASAGVADLVISGGRITGQIRTGNAVFRITPLRGGLHRIEEIDGSGFPGDIELPSPAAPDDYSKSAQTEGRKAAVKPVIRVLMPYTGLARLRVGAIDDAAQLAITLANRALTTSNVSARFKLVGTMVIKDHYDPDIKYVRTLKKATGGRKNFAKVHRMRETLKADLVAILRTGDEYCGAGWINLDTMPADAAYGYSVANVDCITLQAVAHEMGHNAGLEHDRYVLSYGPSKRDFNFGYVNLNAEVMSVMAYDWKCRDYGKSCIRAAMFSTPSETYFGAKMGVPKGKAGAADAARTLTTNLPVVAGFR